MCKNMLSKHLIPLAIHTQKNRHFYIKNQLVSQMFDVESIKIGIL